MRVSSINANKFHPLFVSQKHKNNNYNTKPKELSRGEKITICALSMATIGIGIAAIAISKKPNSTTAKFIKKQKFSLNRKIQKAQKKQDPAIKMLKGRRDALALNDYNAFITRKKIASLNNKVLNNEINMNDPKVYKHIVRNKVQMERDVTNLLT